MTKRLLALALVILGLQAVAKSCGAAVSGAVEKQDTIGKAMLKSLADGAQEKICAQLVPSLVFAAGGGSKSDWLLQEQIDTMIPYYRYLTRDGEREEDDEMTDFRTILLAEAQEGTEAEESLAESTDIQDIPDRKENPSDEPSGETLGDLLQAENEAALQERQVSSFIPHGKQNQVDLGPLKNYETLIQQFYTVDANTTAGSDRLNVEKLLGEDMRIPGDGSGPQILIYHTHSQESFADSVPGDASTTILGVGERLKNILTETYGYEVIHHLGQYDIDSRDDSYSAALGDIEQILRDYPSIQVVIDLHRDEMPETTRLVMDLDGRPTARFMFFNGLSHTKKTGNIAYLYNENLDSNLAFSFQMQMKAVEYYPGLTRKIYLKGYRYNMHLKPRCLLVELGAQNNTVEEAMNACDPLAHILSMVLSGEE